MSKLLIRASIVAYLTDSDELAKCVASLRGDGVECITVVDNSPDTSLSAVCRRLGIDYVHSGSNVGYGAGHNIDLRRSLELDADYHLVINSDVYFEPGVIGPIVEKMESDPNIGLLSPRMVYPGGRLQYNVRLLPTPLDLILRRFLPHGLCSKRRRHYLLADWHHNDEAVLPFHQGSFLFLRVKALKKCGLFDERYFMYCEDIDFSRRMHRLYTTLYYPKVSIVHIHRAASYKSKKMMLTHLISAVRYFNKWGWIADGERREINRREISKQ